VSVSINETRGEVSLEADSRRRVFLMTVGLVALLAIVALLSLTHGAVPVPSGRVADILIRAIEARGGDPTQNSLVVLHIRLPRLFLGMMIGAALAMSGALMQGLFRNPLADPGLAGVSAGAGLGAALAIVLGDRVPQGFAGLSSLSLLPAAAFLGALAATSTLYAVATRGGRTSVATMLLAGVALAASELVHWHPRLCERRPAIARSHLLVDGLARRRELGQGCHAHAGNRHHGRGGAVPVARA
jgi:iron complex transport system permease protein